MTKYFNLNPKADNYNEEFSHAITENGVTTYYSRWNSSCNKVVNENESPKKPLVVDTYNEGVN